MDDMKPVTLPSGVELRDPHDMDTLRNNIFDRVAQGMMNHVNGHEYGNVRLELDNLGYADKEHYTLAEQREKLLSDDHLSRRLRGNIRLIDTETNKVLDIKENVTLAKVPYLTQRGTMLHNGSEYSPISQSRLLPGAYTRERDNGELETQFNVRPGTGRAMRVQFNPTDAVYRIKIGNTNVHAYSLFKDLGYSDEQLAESWGSDILALNQKRYDPKALDRVYNRMVREWDRKPGATREDKVQAVKEALNNAQIAENIAKRNLPSLFDRTKSAAWRHMAMGMEKTASFIEHRKLGEVWNPDLDPEQAFESLAELDFDLASAMCKFAANIEMQPDYDPSALQDVHDALYAKRGPRLASIHAYGDSDPADWLAWYKRYSDGERSDEDKDQIRRWMSFRAKHGSLFRSNPTPRRAYALRNWAIDPLKMLPEESRADFQKSMDSYKNSEFMKWHLKRHTYTQDEENRLLNLAQARGFSTDPENVPGSLMRAATEGIITHKDISY